MSAGPVRLVPFHLTMQHERDKHAHFADPSRMVSWRDLEGKTIRHVCESPSGQSSSLADLVLVFDDDTWALVGIDRPGEDSSIELDDWYTRQLGAADIMSPHELWEAGMVNDAQRDYLQAKRQEADRAKAKAEADALRKRADQIEKEGRHG